MPMKLHADYLPLSPKWQPIESVSVLPRVVIISHRKSLAVANIWV